MSCLKQEEWVMWNKTPTQVRKYSGKKIHGDEIKLSKIAKFFKQVNKWFLDLKLGIYLQIIDYNNVFEEQFYPLKQ